MATQQNILNQLRMPSFWVGAFLVLAGALSLVYLGVVVIQLIQSPAESDLLKWFAVNVELSELVLNGRVNENTFEINASEVFQYMVMGILA